jgi:hypothetical protein
MTQTKTILGLSLAAIFVAMIVPALADGHLTITEGEVSSTGTVTRVDITTAGDLSSADGAFGYGVVAENGVVAFTTHGGVGPDSEKMKDQSDAVMHTHLVALVPNSACVNTGLQAIPSFEEVGHAKVSGDSLKVTAIPTSVTGELSTTFVSFGLSIIGDAASPDAICIETPTFFDFSEED